MMTPIDREHTIDDSISAQAIICNALPKRQRDIIFSISYGGQLIQNYEYGFYLNTLKKTWYITGYHHTIPHTNAVKALIRKNIIIPNGMSDKEYQVQTALGTAGPRYWKINPELFDPLIDAVCLIRLVKKELKLKKVFNVSL